MTKETGLGTLGTGLIIDANGMVSVDPTVASKSFMIQRSIEGVVYETTLMYWVAPATCTIQSVSMALSSNPTESNAYCKVQVMKNGLMETDSIFNSDLPMSISDTTSPTNGVYQASGTLDNAMKNLAAGDVIQFRVNQADTGSADLLITMIVTTWGVIMGTSYGAPQIQSLFQNCVLWAPLSDSQAASGYDVFPIIPSGVTVTNNGTFTKTSLGNNKSVLNFDGSTNSVSLSDNASFTLGTNAFSLVMWIMFRSDGYGNSNWKGSSDQGWKINSTVSINWCIKLIYK